MDKRLYTLIMMLAIVFSTGAYISDTAQTFQNPEAFSSTTEKCIFTSTLSARKNSEYTVLKFSNYGDKIGTLTIPNINMYNAAVFLGDTPEILEKGIGQYYGDCYPGQGGKIVLCGHNYMTLAKLKSIKTGDNITYKTAYGTYVYQVEKTSINKETDGYLIKPDNSCESLVIYTCYPFSACKHYSYRFFVFAKVVSEPKTIIEE